MNTKCLLKPSVFIIILSLFMTIFSGCDFSKKIIYRNPQKYTLCRSGESARKEFQDKLGMDEDIFPLSLNPEWDIKNFIMLYYNPFDPQYLGYVNIQYTESDYIAEVERLKNYSSTEYEGVYGIKGFSSYELLAINANPNYGVIYALTDGSCNIVYVEMIFCNYYMDIEYTKYIPVEYLPDNFDAHPNNIIREQFDNK